MTAHTDKGFLLPGYPRIAEALTNDRLWWRHPQGISPFMDSPLTGLAFGSALIALIAVFMLGVAWLLG